MTFWQKYFPVSPFVNKSLIKIGCLASFPNFTELAHWAYSVLELWCMSLCMSVCLCVCANGCKKCKPCICSEITLSFPGFSFIHGRGRSIIEWPQVQLFSQMIADTYAKLSALEYCPFLPLCFNIGAPMTEFFFLIKHKQQKFISCWRKHKSLVNFFAVFWDSTIFHRSSWVWLVPIIYQLVGCYLLQLYWAVSI